jgi:hypothetical protein
MRRVNRGSQVSFSALHGSEVSRTKSYRWNVYTVGPIHPLEVVMYEFMKDFKDVGLMIASGIVGIGLLALFAQIALFGLFFVRRLRAIRRKPVKIEVLPAPEIKYLPRI